MSTETLTVEKAADDSLATVRACGAVTIEHAAQLREHLAQALGQVRQVLLDLSQISESDITIVQVICSACRTAAENRIPLRFTGEFPECIKNLSQAAGIPVSIPCRHNNNEPCFFSGGTD